MVGHIAWRDIFSVIFFVTLFTLGIDSVYAWNEVLVSLVHTWLEQYGYITKTLQRGKLMP
jgi:hypothetical protein